MANNFIKYLVYTPEYILEKDDVKLLNTTSKEELVKTIFKRDGKKIIKSLLSKKREKPNIDYRGVYIHPELSIVGIARIPEGGVLEDYEKYIHLLNDDLANYVINNIINILDGKGIDDNGLNLVIDKKVEEIIARKLPAIFTYKGSVDKVTDLPKDNNKVGDTYNVNSTGANYTWDGSKWDKLSETVDLSNLATKEEVKTLINEVKSEITESKEYYLIKEEYKYKQVSNKYTEGLANEVNPNSWLFSKYRDYLITDLNDILVPLTFDIEVKSDLDQYAIDNKTKIGKWEFKATPEKIMENINKNTIKIIYTYLLEFTPDPNFDFTKDRDKDGIPDYKDPNIKESPSSIEDPEATEEIKKDINYVKPTLKSDGYSLSNFNIYNNLQEGSKTWQPTGFKPDTSVFLIKEGKLISSCITDKNGNSNLQDQEGFDPTANYCLYMQEKNKTTQKLYPNVKISYKSETARDVNDKPGKAVDFLVKGKIVENPIFMVYPGFLGDWLVNNVQCKLKDIYKYRAKFLGLDKNLAGKKFETSEIWVITTRITSLDKYTFLQYDINEGTGETPRVENPLLTGVEYQVAASDGITPPKGTYFKCWKINGKEYSPGDTIILSSEDENIAYAIYEKISQIYTIAFDTKGGSPIDSKTVKHGESITLPTKDEVSQVGFELKSWKRESDNKIFNPGDIVENITQDETFEAVWGYPIVTITFNPNGGTGNPMPIMSGKKGDKINLPDATFTPPSDMIFSHWEIIEGAESGAVTQSEKNNQTLYIGSTNIVLKAIWIDIDYYVIFKSQDLSSKDIYIQGESEKYVILHKDNFTLTFPEGFLYMPSNVNIDPVFDYWEFKGKKYKQGDTVQLSVDDFKSNSHSDNELIIIGYYKIDIGYLSSLDDYTVMQGQKKVIHFYMPNFNRNTNEVDYEKSKCELVYPINGLSLKLKEYPLSPETKYFCVEATFAPKFYSTSNNTDIEIKVDIVKKDGTTLQNCKGVIKVYFNQKP